jgi:hypothetical protein
MNKLINKLRADPRVESIDDERRLGHGWFVYLEGHCLPPGTGEAHCFTEATARDVQKKLRWVVKCECADCKKGGTWK